LILHHLDARHIRTELLIEATENTRNGTGSRSSHKVDQRHEGNYVAVAAMNASPTRKVGPALVVSAEDPRFEGKFNGRTHMGMLGSTASAHQT
jgi:hypothetical protein